MYINVTKKDIVYTTDRYDTSRLNKVRFIFLMPPFTKIYLSGG